MTTAAGPRYQRIPNRPLLLEELLEAVFDLRLDVIDTRQLIDVPLSQPVHLRREAVQVRFSHTNVAAGSVEPFSGLLQLWPGVLDVVDEVVVVDAGQGGFECLVDLLEGC